MQTPSKVSSTTTELDVLKDIQTILQSVQTETRHLAAAVANLDERITLLAVPKSIPDVANDLVNKLNSHNASPETSPLSPDKISDVDAIGNARTQNQSAPGRNPNPGLGGKSRIILTTYPGQSGIHPVAINWGHEDPVLRGPVVVSRNQSTIRRRNGMCFGTDCHEMNLNGSNIAPNSNWCPWWLIFHLSCSGCS